MKNINKKQLLVTTLLSGAAFSMMAAPSYAQDSGDDEIVVTGSRIAKKDFISNSPVATVDAIAFESVGAINTESLLNDLPQTVPGLDRTSNNPGNGTATVDLRGLGSNRTLVLVNGRRAMPNGSAGVVDINTIAPAMIKSVEVLTGGASSVYGADAVSGVVNFILKDDFEGVEANIGYQSTDQGDAGQASMDLTLGANSPDGKGNATVNVSYTDRQQLFQGDRDFAAVVNQDNGDVFRPGGSGGRLETTLFSTGNQFNQDGSLTTGNPPYNYAPVNFIQLPQERFTISSTANYEINRHAEVYLEGRFANNTVPQQLAPTPIFSSVQFSLDGNPFLTPGAQAELSPQIGDGVDTDGDGIDDTATGFVGRRLQEVGPRFGSDTRNTFQLVGGVRGDITDKWSYDAYVSEGRTQASSFQTGNVNRGRFNQGLLLADADGDGNVDLNADGTPVGCADGSTNGSTTGCAPINIFGAGNISDAAAAFLRTAVSTTDETVQRVAQANLIGELGNLGWSETPIGIAVGAEYIANEFVFRPSQDVAASTIAGFNGAPPVQGEYDVYSAYGELSIPIVEGVSFADSITLDLAGRVSDFSTIGTEYNYKIGGDWAINDQIRLRGNYNTAVRAPNIGELFSPLGENFPGAQDPCSAAPYAPDPIPAAVAAVCAATGVPAAVIGSPNINAPSNQVRSLVGGNASLQAEKAETITFGAVISPNAIEGLSMSIDYFDIAIDGAIAAFGGGTANILNVCYTDAEQGGPGSAFCNAITRRPSGSILSVSNQSINVAGTSLKGIDAAVTYSRDLSDLGSVGDFLGNLSLNYLGTYTIENTFQAFDGDTVFDCAGFFGNNCGEPDPTYRHRMTARVSKNALSTSFTWQLLGGVEDGGFLNPSPDAQTDATIKNIGVRHYFDASVNWDVTDYLALTLGANNVLDSGPPILGDNQEQANTYPATYDVFGRTFFANAKFKF